jgi:hypothetical protein
MGSTETVASVFLKTYRALRFACEDTRSGVVGATTWPAALLSQKLEQLEAAHELLPPVLRKSAWILTSVERAA